MMNAVRFSGENAGKLFHLLSNKGPQSPEKLLKQIKLSDKELYAAVGWLARENKILYDEGVFRLGDTNLTSKIGRNAGRVWQVLHVWGEMDNVSISRLARIPEEDVFSAIGWLAREDKVDGQVIKGKQQKMKFWLVK